MKRDLELIRKLLIFFDERPEPTAIWVPEIPGYDDPTIKYHLVLLHDAGYLRCEAQKTATGRVISVLPFELTWSGHEFLDRVRNELIWDEVRNKIKEKGFVSASVDFIKKLADKQIRKRLDMD